MKVALAANHGEFGGGEVMLMAIARALRDLDHEVQVVVPATPDAVTNAARKEGFRTIAIHGEGAKAYLAGLRRWDARERDGLLWCNGLRPALATAGHRNRIVHLHQLPTGPQTAAARVAVQGARAVMVPSNWMQAQLGVPSQVLQNWTDPVEASRPTTEAPVRLGFLGRLSVAKGAIVLAEALRLLEAETPGGHRLLVAGESRFTSPADAQALTDAFRGLEHVMDRRRWMDRAEFFSSIDLAVFPSVFPESFGLVAAEAMAAGCPFVISDAGALPEVAGRDHRWVARTGDPRELARTIRLAVEQHTDEDTANARARWESFYSPAAGRLRLEHLMAQLSEA